MYINKQKRKSTYESQHLRFLLLVTRLSTSVYSRYSVDHVQTHLDATVGVVRPVLGKTAHTVITVSQQFDSQTRVFLSQSVEPIHKPPRIYQYKLLSIFVSYPTTVDCYITSKIPCNFKPIRRFSFITSQIIR